jgi:hypothetical protein
LTYPIALFIGAQGTPHVFETFLSQISNGTAVELTRRNIAVGKNPQVRVQRDTGRIGPTGSPIAGQQSLTNTV